MFRVALQFVAEELSIHDPVEPPGSWDPTDVPPNILRGEIHGIVAYQEEMVLFIYRPAAFCQPGEPGGTATGRSATNQLPPRLPVSDRTDHNFRSFECVDQNGKLVVVNCGVLKAFRLPVQVTSVW